MGHAGFTAVELLITGGIAFGLVGGMMLMTTDAGSRVFTRTDAQATTMSAAQRVLNRLREDLHAASLAAGATCLPGDLRMTRASDGAVIRYQLDAATETIRRTVGAATSVISGNVSAMTFPACANGVVRVALTTRVVPGRWQTATHTVESQMRIQNP
jgi:hypothetical protein